MRISLNTLMVLSKLNDNQAKKAIQSWANTEAYMGDKIEIQAFFDKKKNDFFITSNNH